MLTNPLTPIVVGHFQIKIHHLFRHRALTTGDTFVKQQLVFNLCHCRTFNSCGVRNDGVQIELLVIYLVQYAQFLVALEQLQQHCLVFLFHTSHNYYFNRKSYYYCV